MSEEKKVNGFLVSKTDTRGRITYCNQAFIDISGFSENELLGKPHNIVRHKDMPRSIFAYLWREIAQKKEVNVYVKNLAKDGGYYWVFANVTPSLDTAGKVIGYYSVRRKPNPKGVSLAIELYAKIQEAEKQGGIESGLAFFHKFFADLKQSYDNFILHAQVGGE
ncbi:PAS domain-containing protein [Helicobacter marmotae]|uniref:PAS domain S-box protein n=1 Tax=Helicobacter marmotae TaxID=152490 RepID=A0A3D8I402_9HELI|nr:PAS domain-containing protein [Helicobacter marmotae]RDU59857.1 PAS domain S-box protein [Helicobacter marmotae]